MRMTMNVDELERREPAARGWLNQATELARAWGVCTRDGGRRAAEERALRIVAARIWQMTRGRPSFAAIDVDGVHEDLTAAFVGAAAIGAALRVVLRPGDALFIPKGWLHMIVANEPPAPPRSTHPSLSLNIFFVHPIQPTFKVFETCDPSSVQRAYAQMPHAHRVVLERRYHLERARSAYCIG